MLERLLMAASMSPIVPNVDIDDEGTFKYILVQITNESNRESRLIVRGYKWADYHAYILNEVEKVSKTAGYNCKCMGGGRIKHNPADKTILVYGYSVGFGKADHQKTVELLQDSYSNYKSISFSDEGY